MSAIDSQFIGVGARQEPSPVPFDNLLGCWHGDEDDLMISGRQCLMTLAGMIFDEHDRSGAKLSDFAIAHGHVEGASEDRGLALIACLANQQVSQANRSRDGVLASW